MRKKSIYSKNSLYTSDLKTIFVLHHSIQLNIFSRKSFVQHTFLYVLCANLNLNVRLFAKFDGYMHFPRRFITIQGIGRWQYKTYVCTMCTPIIKLHFCKSSAVTFFENSLSRCLNVGEMHFVLNVFSSLFLEGWVCDYSKT